MFLIRKLIHYSKYVVGELLAAFGAGLFFYNVLNFSVSRGCGISRPSRAPECDNPVAYFYDVDAQFFAAVGIGLFVFGLLMIRNKRDNQN